MIRGILSAVVAVVLIGLGIALLQAFNWDIGALLTWAWEFIMGLIEGVASFFTGNPTFQKLVSS